MIRTGRVLWGKRQDGLILNSQDRYRCQIHEEDFLADLLTQVVAYEREWLGADSAVLQFRTEVGGLDVSGVDMITWDADGLIVDFTVMVRPAKALQAVIEHMGAELLRMLEAADRPPA